jgi:hypothetical protein
MNWAHLAQDTVQWQIFRNEGNFLTVWATINFPKSILLHGVGY